MTAKDVTRWRAALVFALVFALVLGSGLVALSWWLRDDHQWASAIIRGIAWVAIFSKAGFKLGIALVAGIAALTLWARKKNTTEAQADPALTDTADTDTAATDPATDTVDSWPSAPRPDAWPQAPAAHPADSSTWPQAPTPDAWPQAPAHDAGHQAPTHHAGHHAAPGTGERPQAGPGTGDPAQATAGVGGRSRALGPATAQARR